MSTDVVNDMLNLNGATFQGCDFEGFSPQAGVRSEGCTYYVGSGETLVLSGHCRDITIISDGGCVRALNGTQFENLNIQGQRCTLQLGNDCTLNGGNARGTCFISLECGNDVNISNSDFRGAFICSANFHGHTCFKNVDFCAAHLNPSFAGCSLVGCKIDDHTRFESANLERCRSIVDLYHEGIGFVRCTSALGLAANACSLSPQAVLHNAGVGGACDTQSVTCSPSPDVRSQTTGMGKA